MEYIKILVSQFLAERNFLQAMNLCQDIINAEDVPEKSLQRELDWIKKNTTETLRIPYAVVETYVSKNADKPLTHSVEVPMSTGERKMYKEFDLIDLIVNLKEAYENMRKIVTKIAKKYSLSIPFQQNSGISQSNIPVIE